MSTFPQRRHELEPRAQSENFDDAVMAVMELAMLDETEGRLDDAEAAYGEVIRSGHEGQAARATFALARLLEGRGELDRARAAYQYLLSSGASDYAGPAVCAVRKLDRAARQAR